jgi:OmpA-OmpF porin, OOP family
MHISKQITIMKQLLLIGIAFIASQTPASSQELKSTLQQSVLRVFVKDDKDKPQAGQLVSFKSMKDGKEYSGTTNAEGKFTMLIPPGQKYKVTYKLFSTVQNDLTMDMPVSARPYSFDYTITATPPRTFTLDNVFFDSGKSTLRPESNKAIDELAEYMNLKKTLVIEIAGHTDNVGAPEANLKLSEDRAKAVKQYLQKKGIAADRVSAKGYGDTQPIADNGTEAGKQKNRRTEVHILSE